MHYYLSDASFPVEYVSSGNLVSETGFVHPSRNIDTYVLIAVITGALPVTQGETAYTVRENEYLLLFPHMHHYGHKPSEGPLSYYWTHFYVSDPRAMVCPQSEFAGALARLAAGESKDKGPMAPLHYVIPEYGQLSAYKRCQLLFVQLLDFAKRGNYMASWWCHYGLSLLLLEISNETPSEGQLIKAQIPTQVSDVVEWVRSHYDRPLTVASIAGALGYHPTYLTKLFKQYMGVTIMTYINATRINASKNLLADRKLFVYEISDMCGFFDVKYFFRQFKRHEGMTPTQYRHAFNQKKINKS